MKANLEAATKYLNENEKILSFLYCKIHLVSISRSGILIATTDKLLFCADAIIGKGLKWEFPYKTISNLNENDGAVLGTVPFIKKILLNCKEDLIIFENFSNPSKVNDFLKLIKSKMHK
ncbi:PH domain-containing protein [Priestia aryabhattai]